MELGLITLMSALHDEIEAEKSHSELINALKGNYNLKFIPPSEAQKVDMTLVFVASGGTEEKFIEIYDDLDKPVFLLTDGLHNSLAASLEIQSWVKQQGDMAEILHGDIEYLKKRINTLYNKVRAINKLKTSRIGVIGFPSSWLISSDVDYIKAKKRWGITYKNIELDRLYELISHIDKKDAEATANRFLDESKGIKETNDSDILEASRIYLALRELYKENALDAATLRCFDLLSKYNNTGCLALSLLNDENLISGCEGDCQSIFSMYLLKLLTGEIPFMANPAMIETGKNEIILAHCTIATSITEEYIIRTHFESQIGVGIQGILKEGPITLFKCGGSDLSEYFVSKGEIIENLDSLNRCRTQLRVKLENDVRYFLNNPIANHHIIIKGDYRDEIVEFMENMACIRR